MKIDPTADRGEQMPSAILTLRPMRLTIPTEDDVAFLTRFVHRPFDYSYHSVDGVAHTRSTWRSLERLPHSPLDSAALMGHLQQERAYAVYCAVENTPEGTRRCMTSWIVIDLDNHDDNEDLCARMRGVVKALGPPSFVQGSPSGGAHAYYCLDEWTHIYELHVIDSPIGIVTRLLEANGVHVARGNAEVYPNPRSMNRRGNVIRLPFGFGSWLLDPWDLSIRDGQSQGVDVLRRVRDWLDSGELPIASVEEWRTAAREYVAPKAKQRTRGGHSAITEAERRFAPFRDGLTKAGTRETAVAAHAYLCRARGCTLAEAVQLTDEWLTKNHNGNSTTVARRGLAYCVKESEATVKRIYKNKRGNGVATRVSLPALTLAEVQLIMEFVMDAARSVDADGNPLDLFWVAHHAFWLMRYAVQEALTNVRDHQVLRPAGGRMRLTSRAWPDCAQPFFIVPIPWDLRHKKIVDDASRKSMFTAPAGKEVAIFHALSSGPAPLIRKVHGHFAFAGLCAHFEVRIDLEGDRCVTDIATAFLLAGGSARVVRSQLRPCHWRRVASAFTQPVAPLRDVGSTAEMLAAREIHAEALDRAAAGCAAGSAIPARSAGHNSFRGGLPRPTSWVTPDVAPEEEARVAATAMVDAAALARTDHMSVISHPAHEWHAGDGDSVDLAA